MNYLKKFLGIKSLNTKQCPAELFPRIIPPPLLYQTTASKSFWLIRAGPLYKGDGCWSLLYFSEKIGRPGKFFPPKMEGYYEKIIYDFASLCF